MFAKIMQRGIKKREESFLLFIIFLHFDAWENVCICYFVAWCFGWPGEPTKLIVEFKRVFAPGIKVASYKHAQVIVRDFAWYVSGFSAINLIIIEVQLRFLL
jgi:hypothetical protein